METNHHTDSHLHPTEMENPGYLAEMCSSLKLVCSHSLDTQDMGYSGWSLHDKFQVKEGKSII